jgi:hypothetical protein
VGKIGADLDGEIGWLVMMVAPSLLGIPFTPFQEALRLSLE